MAIRPVSSVSFRNYSNLAFEGKKNNKHPRHSYATSTIKAIPVAALIAMSPMVSAEDAFSLAPNEPRVEYVSGLDGAQQSRVVPLPSNCKILKEVRIDKSSGGYEQFGLIDTNGDGSNFEILEYRDVGSSGKVLNRGILKGIYFHKVDNQVNLKLLGIQLNNNNLEDYSPQTRLGMFSVYYPNANTDKVEFYEALLKMRENNGAVWEIAGDNSDVYRTEPYYYSKDLVKYKKTLGIY